MEATNYKSVGETYKTKARFAQLDMEVFQRLKNLGYQPQVIPCFRRKKWPSHHEYLPQSGGQ
jgi:hypothetical protein